jgi:tetratricopeptide (TPR) repeat protein
VEYMSPEQVRGLAVDGRTDMFSLGVTLYELLTGARPFTAPLVSDIIAGILLKEPAPVSSLIAGVPASVDGILRRALAKNTDDRYASMTDMRADVQRYRQELERDQVLTTRGPSKAGGPPLAGRDTEIAGLLESFTLAVAGSGLVQCIAGEAGIGKTTLVENFTAHVRATHGATVARGSCSERLAGTEVYLPILEALDTLVHGPGGHAIAEKMKSIAPSWYAQVAPPEADDPAFGAVMAQLRNSSAERLKREMVALLQAAATRAPVILFVEDVHWSDESTTELLAYLGTRLQGMRVLVVVTYRPSELHRVHHPFLPVKLDLQSRGACREIRLGSLRREDVDAYIAQQFPHHRFPPDLLALVYEKTEGYPLFFVDLCRYLRDHHLLAESLDGWHLRGSVESVARELPESVRSMIERKVDQLSEDDRHLLSVASVQGQTFTAAIVARALNLDEAVVEDRLNDIARRFALIDAVGEVELPDATITIRYRFGHGLYQNAVFAALTPTRRARLSYAVGEALLAAGSPDGDPAPALAVLFESGRDFLRSANYFGDAARAAADIFAYREAIALARRGLAVLRHVDEGDERARTELKLQVALIRPLKARFGYSSTDLEETYARVKDLSDRLGAHREAFFVLSGFCSVQTHRQELTAALSLAEHCAAIARSGQDDALVAQAAWHRGQLLHYLGRLVEARDQFEEGLRIYHPAVHNRALTLFGLVDGPLMSMGLLARVLWYLGYPDQARRMMARGIDVARSVADQQTAALLLCTAGLLAATMRDRREVGECVTQLGTIQFEHALVNGITTMLQAWALSHDRPGNEPERLFRDGHSAYMRVSRISGTVFAAMHADILLSAGGAAEALPIIEQALAVVDRTGERVVEAELWRLRAEALIARGGKDAADAECALARAVDIAHNQSAKSWELRAALSQAKLLRHQGRDQGHEALRRILEWFTEGMDTPDQVVARSFLGGSAR